jgi:hypothetical protein
MISAMDALKIAADMLKDADDATAEFEDVSATYACGRMASIHGFLDVVLSALVEHEAVEDSRLASLEERIEDLTKFKASADALQSAIKADEVRHNDIITRIAELSADQDGNSRRIFDLEAANVEGKSKRGRPKKK